MILSIYYVRRAEKQLHWNQGRNRDQHVERNEFN